MFGTRFLLTTRFRIKDEKGFTDGDKTTWTLLCLDNPAFTSIEIIYDETQQYIRSDNSRDRYDFENLKLTIEQNVDSEEA